MDAAVQRRAGRAGNRQDRAVVEDASRHRVDGHHAVGQVGVVGSVGEDLLADGDGGFIASRAADAGLAAAESRLIQDVLRHRVGATQSDDLLRVELVDGLGRGGGQRAVGRHQQHRAVLDHTR